MGRAESGSFHQLVTKAREKTIMTGAAGDDSRGAGGRRHAASGSAGRGFGERLATAAQAIIADARSSLASAGMSDAETVHEVRKALKRWRAWLRLLAEPLGEPADQMRAEARELMRSLAGARDAQSALDALADLRKSAAAASPPVSATTLSNIETRLTAVRDAAEQAGFTPETRERLLRYLDEAALTIERWPLDHIDFDTVAAGLTATYRRARRLIPDDWAAADPDHLHDLRRRVVEHRHQMDLFEPLWPRLGQVWGEEAQRLRNRLGACQDLAMLVKFTAPHQPLAPWRSRLAPAIAARRLAHLKAGERLAGRLFAEKPKAFRRRIAALWTARRAKHAKR
jgi:CHAD domain-containing protein